ncbi:MAG TPA: nuclear transport factor 2 family protein [Gemmatimonadales bacterium]
MRVSHLIVITSLLAACQPAAPPPPAAPSEADLAMAGAILDTMAAAIGRHDGTLMASVYATRPSAAAITQGEAAQGPDAIRARYAPWDTASAWSGQVVWADRTLEPLGPDAILATATFTWSQLDPSGKRVEFPGAVWTGVLVREGARWALLHEHESFNR